MAVIAKRDQVWLGDSTNKRQCVVGVAGRNVDEFPGVLNLQYVTSNTATDAYIFLDSAGTTLRVNTTSDFGDSDGSALTGSGADTALSNIASVQIPNAGDLIPATTNQVDIGTTSAQFKDGWFDGTMTVDLLEGDAANIGRVQGAGSNYFKVAASGVVTTEGTSTINGITLTNNANEIKMTKGTASFEIAAGDTDLIIGAAGSLDVAAGKDVNIDQNLTIAGGAFTTSSACTIDQNLAAAQSPTWVGLTLTGAIATPTNITASGYITTSGDIRVTSDTNRLELGAGATDSYIKFDGTNLIFQDSTSGAFTLAELSAGTPLNPIVTGDFTISDGQFDWVNTATADTNVWDFGATTVDTFDIVCDNTTAAFLDIEADTFTAHGTAAEGLIDINVDGITSGNVIVIDTNQAGTFTGSYLKFYTDGSTDAFTVKGYGATVIAGVDGGTAALTLTKGDLVISDGGINADVDSTHQYSFVRAQATTTMPVMEIEATNASDDWPCLLLDHKGDQASSVLDIDSVATSVTSGVVDIDAAVTTGTVLDIYMGTASTSGKGIYVLDDSNDTTARWLVDIYQTNATASHGAVGLRVRQEGGADGIFIDKDANGNALQIDVDAAVASQDCYGIKMDVDNTGTTAGDAYGIYIDDVSSSNGTAFAIYTKGTGECSFNADTDDADFTVASTTNAEMFAIDAGLDTIGINGLVASYQLGMNITDNKSMGGLGIVQNDATGDTTGINVQMAGAGHAGAAIAIDHNGTAGGIGISLDMENVSGTCIDINGPVLTTGNVFVADDCDALTTGGILKLASNSTDTSARNLVSIVQDHASAILANCLYIDQDANSGAYALEIDRDSSDAATQWAVKIDSDNAGGGAGGGVDFSSMAIGDPILKATGRTLSTAGTLVGEIAIDVAGTVRYLEYFAGGTP